jgi:DNA repair exonuclease SbcCD ATPase subunit
MRLISLTVKNFRLHRETTIEFDPHRTLVGGPNESGKSTLAEALHRAFFLKAKATGEVRNAMLPHDGSAAPAVTVVFESGGTEFTLEKRFGGAAGSASLTPRGGPPLHGDAAEEQLARLTGGEVLGGRGADNRLREQWGHLWVWQGEAGNDPAAAVNPRHADLVQIFQQQGGAVVLQSALDRQVAKRFDDFFKENFNQNERPKAGSDWARAEAAAAAADAAVAKARELAGRLAKAADAYAQAADEAREIDRRMPRLEGGLRAAEARKLAADRLAAKVVRRRALAARLDGARDRAKEADQTIRKLRAEITALEQALQPRDQEIHNLREAEAAARTAAATTRAAANAAADQAAATRRQRELARAVLARFDKEQAAAALAARHALVLGHRQEVATLLQNLGALPRIGTADLKKLAELQARLSESTIALNAMAAGLEILEAAAVVRVDGAEAAAGATFHLTGDTELAIGEGTRLRIRPGGGTALCDASRNQAEAGRALQAALEKLALPDVAAARDACERRRQMEDELKATRKMLDQLGDAAIDADLAEARGQAAAARDFQSKLVSGLPDCPLPATPAAARDWLACCEGDCAGAETTATAAAGKANAAEAAANHARQAHADAQARDQGDRATLETKQQLLAIQVDAHGDDPGRAARLARLDARAALATRLLELTRGQFDALQPASIERDLKQFAGAIANDKHQLEKHRLTQAASQAQLAQDGTHDPAAELAAAERAAERSAAERDHHALRARALLRLHHLFTDEQARLAERFTRPLAGKIEAYLQCLFGPDTRVSIDADGTSLRKISVARTGDGGARFDFDTLSGGAREQVAAAVRLAAAEVLAEAAGGTLPVLFDDAFAYSDPRRVGDVQRMLFLAADHGLQVIVLACNPDDYAELGARRITLPVP